MAEDFFTSGEQLTDRGVQVIPAVRFDAKPLARLETVAHLPIGALDIAYADLLHFAEAAEIKPDHRGRLLLPANPLDFEDAQARFVEGIYPGHLARVTNLLFLSQFLGTYSRYNRSLLGFYAVPDFRTIDSRDLTFNGENQADKHLAMYLPPVIAHLLEARFARDYAQHEMNVYGVVSDKLFPRQNRHTLPITDRVRDDAHWLLESCLNLEAGYVDNTVAGTLSYVGRMAKGLGVSVPTVVNCLRNEVKIIPPMNLVANGYAIDKKRGSELPDGQKMSAMIHSIEG